MHLAQEAGGVAAYMFDLATGVLEWSASTYSLYGLPRGVEPSMAAWLASVHPDDRERVERTARLAVDDAAPIRHEFRIVTPAGETRWVEDRGRVLADDDGRPRQIVGLNVDITELKAAQLAQAETEARLNDVLAELSHRSTNMLSVVHSLLRRTASTASDVATFQRALYDRLNGMAASQALLLRHELSSAPLGELIEAQLRPFVSSGDPRVRLSGPDVRLRRRAAETLALAFNELATNACKHGALSNPEGRVDIVWTLSGSRLGVSWIERGGPPVQPPTRSGFGRRVIEAMVRAGLGADVDLAFEAPGLEWRMDAPDTCLET